MSKAEDAVREIIERFQQETLARIKAASDQGQADIIEFVDRYIEGLQIELPVSAEQVLNKGGHLLQEIVLGEMTGLRIDLIPDHGLPVSQNISIKPFSGKVWVTIIIEPIE